MTTYPATAIDASCVDDLPTIASGDLSDAVEPRLRNRIRAEFATDALRAYAVTTGGSDSEPLHQVIGDLLSDLRHLCDALEQTGSLELDFEEIEARAYRRYREELHGEP